MLYRFIALLAATASVVSAEMIPISPDGATVGRIGSNLTTLWTPDMTGEWNDVTIQLMTGDNFQMIPVTTLQTGVDATSLSSYTFTVPEVSPTSKIYFLQFTPNTGNATQVTWTTRFTIAAADGSTTEPAQQTQPDGQNIPWGVGELVGGPVGAVNDAAPVESMTESLSVTESASVASVIASSVASVVSSVSSAASQAVQSVQTSSAMSTSVRTAPTTSAAGASATNTVENASASPSPSTVPANNAAGRVQVAGMGVVGMVAGLVAFAF